MFNFFNSKAKIKLASEKNDVKQYTLTFSGEKGSNKEFVKELLKQTYLYVHVDTSLCFFKYDQAEKKSLEIMKVLEDSAIDFNHRISEDTSNRGAIFGIKVSGTNRTCNIITFIVPKNFNNDLLINKLFEIGYIIYAPLENDNKESMLEKVFLNTFKTENEKNSSFKYSTFLTEHISQCTITTKYLTEAEAEKMFLK